MAQFSDVPSGFFTSTCSQVWGLTHSIFVIVPLKLTGLLASNSAANAWWADTEDDHPVIARPVTQTAMASFVCIVCLLAAHRTEMGALACGSAIPNGDIGAPIHVTSRTTDRKRR